MADSLFDVCLFLPSGEFIGYAGESLPFSAALACSRGVNDHRKPTGPTAVVVPLDAYEKEIKAGVNAYHKGVDAATSSIALNASSEQDDSDVDQQAENATDANVVDRYETIRVTCRQEREQAVQKAFLEHLEVLRDAASLLTDPADLGIVAASLEQLAMALADVDDNIYEEFDYGLSGDLRYTELEEAIGVVR